MKKAGLHHQSNSLYAASLVVNFRQINKNTEAQSNLLDFHYSP